MKNVEGMYLIWSCVDVKRMESMWGAGEYQGGY